MSNLSDLIGGRHSDGKFSKLIGGYQVDFYFLSKIELRGGRNGTMKQLVRVD
jgi:hypothetical protein